LTSIDPNLYEAALIDGAGRLKQTWYISLPGIAPIIALMTVIYLGSVMSAGLDQIYNLYNPTVYSTGDILDTMIFRVGIEEAQYSISAAVGVFKSIVSTALIVISNWLAYKYVGYRVF